MVGGGGGQLLRLVGVRGQGGQLLRLVGVGEGQLLGLVERCA